MRHLFLISIAALMILSSVASAESLKDTIVTEAIVCPPGTEKIGDPPPDGKQVFCQRSYQGSKPIKHGPYRSWYRGGEKKGEGYYSFGEPDGTFTQYFRNGGVKQKLIFDKGVMDGEQFRYFSDGSVELKRTYVKGKLNGKTEQYYPNGNAKFDTNYMNGVPEGTYMAWYPNGERKLQGFFHDQKRSGPWVEYFSDGKKKLEGHFSNGKYDGLVTGYRKDGSTKTLVRYEEGRITKTYRAEAPRAEQAGYQRRSLKKGDTLDERDDLKFAAWEKHVKKSLNAQRKEIADAGGEYRPTGQKEGLAWEAKQERKRHLDTYQKARVTRQAEAAAANSDTPLQGVFNASEHHRKYRMDD